MDNIILQLELIKRIMESKYMRVSKPYLWTGTAPATTTRVA